MPAALMFLFWMLYKLTKMQYKLTGILASPNV